jgi:hypothetical protein
LLKQKQKPPYKKNLNQLASAAYAKLALKPKAEQPKTVGATIKKLSGFFFYA